jgi:hypothetical protein
MVKHAGLLKWLTMIWVELALPDFNDWKVGWVVSGGDNAYYGNILKVGVLPT